MRVQQRADDALAGLEAWEQTSLADLRTELDRARSGALKQVDGLRSGPLADLRELLGTLREGDDVTQDPAPAKAAAKPAQQPPPAAPKPAQAAAPKPLAKPAGS